MIQTFVLHCQSELVSDKEKHSSYNQTQSNITSSADKPALSGLGCRDAAEWDPEIVRHLKKNCDLL